MVLLNIQSMNQNEIKIQSFVGLIHKQGEWFKISNWANITFADKFLQS